MFQNFPYTDMHQLNLDWIIKIAKDFLDQYTHIQQLIADGETSIQNLTTEGLQQLQDKADELETLLNAWYDSHSQDIAAQLASALQDLNAWYDSHSQDIDDQLASALQDLNDWYTTHQGYLNNILAENISEFDRQTSETIASIPADYTELGDSVSNELYNANANRSAISGQNIIRLNLTKYIEYSDGSLVMNSGFRCSGLIPTDNFNRISFPISYAGDNVAVVAYYDASKNYLQSISHNGSLVATDINELIPATAKYVSFCRYGADEYYVYMYNDTLTVIDNSIYEALNVHDRKQKTVYLTNHYYIDYADGKEYPNSGFLTTGLIPTKNFDRFEIKQGYAATNVAIVAFYDANKTYMPAVSIHGTNAGDNFSGEIPANARYVAFCRYYTDGSSYPATLFYKNVTNLSNKKIVWFGTSIPAGGVGIISDGYEGPYPNRLGQMLGATVYNEAVGSSNMRAGTHGSYVTADDPMGYGGMSAVGLMLSFTLSSAEKQAICDNWDSKWKDIVTWYGDQVDMANIDYYKSTSWDAILPKYLTGGSVGRCDVYVFDCGYNDQSRGLGFTDLADVPTNPTDRRYFFGAMRFIAEKIYADNPQAKIILVGHYSTNQWQGGMSTKYLCNAQTELAENLSLPLFKTWEHIGFTFISFESGSTTIVPAISWLPDGIHPSSDTSGKTLQYYANVLYEYFKNLPRV